MSIVTKANPIAARQAHETLVESTDLYADIIEAAGEYDAKVDSAANSSLAAHILNAITVGVNTFVYEAVSPDETFIDYEEEIRVLAAALALHDTNKYVREAYGFDAEGNTAEAFEYYFHPDDEDESGDDFGIETFLGEDYRDDLHYLVQRTEVTEDSTETRATDTEFAGLERYCRIGDSVASVALKQGIEGVHRKLSVMVGRNDVHLLEFTALEQPILNDTLLSATKEVIAGETEREACGVIVGSSPEAVVYLGSPIERSELRDAVAERTSERIIEGEFEFGCKFDWKSFEYDVLAEVAIPVEDKEKAISEAVRRVLEGGPAGDEPFEHIPEVFDQYFPILAKAIYIDKRSNFDDYDIQEAYDRIKEERGNQKIKIHFIGYLVQNYEQHTDFLDALADEVRPALHDDLKSGVDAVGTAVGRFFEGLATPSLGTKEEMCFLCGAEANTRYSKGNEAIYRTYEYSRRLPPHKEYKSICEVCNLEYALLADICARSDVDTRDKIEVAFFYFDNFLGDVRVRSRRVGNLVQADSDELDDREVRTTLIYPQYYIQPLSVSKRDGKRARKNRRMELIRQVMQAGQESGMKVVIGRPFTRFESVDTVFTDEEATRPQELLGLDKVERFGPVPDFTKGERTDSHLRRALQLFKIMSRVGQNAGMENPYLQLDRDTFHSIADFAVVNHDNATGLPDLREYFESYHRNELMQMKDVARSGKTLYGQHRFGSKYKKTRVFREAIHAFLSGMNQSMDDETITEYVESQVYATAKREQFAGPVTTEQASDFVSSVYQYLDENDLYSLKKLSDWENALVNSYYYAFDQLSSEQ